MESEKEIDPVFSIITPTLQRQSLIKTCASLNAQTFSSWEHLVMVDQEFLDIPLYDAINHPQRYVFQCERPHKDGGNSCRRNAWKTAQGAWIFYLDDDNYLADDRILEDIYAIIQNVPYWALFPILRLGQRFYTDPPSSCHVDTMNVVVRQKIAEWPQTDAYGADGVFIEDLVRKYPYAAFPEFRPIAILPKINFCKEDEPCLN
jgi:glycosyltransferase involved in cell wall biosynthesis